MMDSSEIWQIEVATGSLNLVPKWEVLCASVYFHIGYLLASEPKWSIFYHESLADAMEGLVSKKVISLQTQNFHLVDEKVKTTNVVNQRVIMIGWLAKRGLPKDDLDWEFLKAIGQIKIDFANVETQVT
jgi:hypothetical protein